MKFVLKNDDGRYYAGKDGCDDLTAPYLDDAVMFELTVGWGGHSVSPAIPDGRWSATPVRVSVREDV